MPTDRSGRPDRSRGGDDAVDGPVDGGDLEVPTDHAGGADDTDAGDALAEDAPDTDEADLADADDADLEDDADADRDAPGTTLTRTRRRAGTATSLTKASTRPATRADRGRAKGARRGDTRTANPFLALARFVREVVGEMRKVLWPTRRELIVYTIAVILFVTIMISIVGGLDFGFARLILFVFG